MRLGWASDAIAGVYAIAIQAAPTAKVNRNAGELISVIGSFPCYWSFVDGMRKVCDRLSPLRACHDAHTVKNWMMLAAKTSGSYWGKPGDDECPKTSGQPPSGAGASRRML
jgi:hypothetical protein